MRLSTRCKIRAPNIKRVKRSCCVSSAIAAATPFLFNRRCNWTFSVGKWKDGRCYFLPLSPSFFCIIKMKVQALADAPPMTIRLENSISILFNKQFVVLHSNEQTQTGGGISGGWLPDSKQNRSAAHTTVAMFANGFSVECMATTMD